MHNCNLLKDKKKINEQISTLQTQTIELFESTRAVHSNQYPFKHQIKLNPVLIVV